MQVKQYDDILLKDGREGCVVEVFDNIEFLVDVGNSPEDWETISININEIARVIKHNS